MRSAVFEVTSVVTTTGYFTVDYGQWPIVALMTLALLFFVGGCAGSTSGSIKIARHLLVARLLGRQVVGTAHPELLRPVRLNGIIVDLQTLLAVISFVLIYVAVFVLGAGVLAIEASAHGPELEPLEISLRLRVHAGQLRRRPRCRRYDRLVRPVRRRLDDHHDRADVARAARDPAGRRAAAPQLLARIAPRSGADSPRRRPAAHPVSAAAHLRPPMSSPRNGGNRPIAPSGRSGSWPRPVSHRPRPRRD